MALQVSVFPPACIWPCEAACRKEDGKIRESTGGYPWLSASVMDGGFWFWEAQESGLGKLQFLDIF